MMEQNANRREFRLDAALVMFVALITYGLLIPQLGFYRDDWYMLQIGQERGAEGLIAIFQTDRPFIGYLFAIYYRLLGTAPLGWHILALVYRMIGGVSFLWLLRLLFPGRREYTFWLTILYVVYPGFLQQPIAGTYIHLLLAVAASVLSLALTASALRSADFKWRIVLIAGASALALLYLLIFESMIGLEAARFCIIIYLLVQTRQMSLPGRKFDPYHRLIYGSVDCFIAITRLVAAQAQKNLPIPPEKIYQIYYGVGLPQLDPQRSAEVRKELGLEGAFLVGVLGRVTEPKGQHLLVQAIQALRSEGIPAVGLIAGEPFEKPYSERLTRMVQERKLSESVRFMAFHPQPYEIMSACDVVALTSKAETFGLVLVEAMQCGVAVVGSDAEGVPEIIDDGRTGRVQGWPAHRASG